MKKIFFLPVLLLIMLFCTSQTVDEKLPLLPSVNTAEFGPFFIPDSSYVNGVYVVYFTQKAQNTSLRFSIAGDMDWARTHYKQVKKHVMHFPEMEEGTFYRFEIQGDYNSLQYRSSIMTKPYGKTYQYTYTIATPENLAQVGENTDILFVSADRKSIDLKGWQQIVQKNPKLFARSVVIPLMDFEEETGIPYRLNDLDFVHYKNSRYIFVRDDVDVNLISKFFSKEEEDDNFILAVNVTDDTLNRILSQYSLYVDKVYGHNKIEHTKYYRLTEPVIKRVSKNEKKKFAMNKVDG